jgi:hypothetical protein
MDECDEGALGSSWGGQWGVLRRVPPSKHVEEPRLRAVTPAYTKRFGEGRHFGVQARALAREGSTKRRKDGNYQNHAMS